MKLRFGLDPAAVARLRDALDAAAPEPAVGRKLSYLYLDTPEGALAAAGVALRFRRRTRIGKASAKAGRAPAWRRQTLFPDGEGAPISLKALGIRRLKQRVDATFCVRIERWTWAARPWADVSIDDIAITTGRAEERSLELRIRCRRRHRDRATRLAVELGASSLVSVRARERGQALLASPDEARGSGV